MNRSHQKYSLVLPLIAVVLLAAPHVALAFSPFQETLYFLVVNLFGMLVRVGGAILNFAINNPNFVDQMVNIFDPFDASFYIVSEEE